MVLSKEDIEEVKGQLRQQIANLPADKKAEAERQINELSDNAVEALVEEQRGKASAGGGKTIYRMIVDGDVESVKIGENEYGVAVLEINPISKGHVLVIPKKVVEVEGKLPKDVLSLAGVLAKRIIKELKAKSAKIQTEKKFGECVVNVIPSYEKNKEMDLRAGRSSASKEELLEVAGKLRERVKIKREVKKVKLGKTPPKEIIVMKRRIP